MLALFGQVIYSSYYQIRIIDSVNISQLIHSQTSVVTHDTITSQDEGVIVNYKWCILLTMYCRWPEAHSPRAYWGLIRVMYHSITQIQS